MEGCLGETGAAFNAWAFKRVILGWSFKSGRRVSTARQNVRAQKLRHAMLHKYELVSHPHMLLKFLGCPHPFSYLLLKHKYLRDLVPFIRVPLHL
jgi:hypothetical protein